VWTNDLHKTLTTHQIAEGIVNLGIQISQDSPSTNNNIMYSPPNRKAKLGREMSTTAGVNTVGISDHNLTYAVRKHSSVKFKPITIHCHNHSTHKVLMKATLISSLALCGILRWSYKGLEDLEKRDATTWKILYDRTFSKPYFSNRHNNLFEYQSLVIKLQNYLNYIRKISTFEWRPSRVCC
jgi:hypothetical protein